MRIRLLSACLLALAGCRTAIESDCSNGVDDDGDGLVDCADYDCAAASCEELCDDAFDNDGDGLTDCLDDDCDGSCEENCLDGRDNDGDNAIDALDSDCFDLLATPEICDDTVDNDGDGTTDCDDPDCFGDRCAEVCDDGLDNDGDGAADCFDSDCDGGCDEVCADGRDNDGDDRIDCQDDDCLNFCANREICDDGLDNDGDGAADCLDPDCFGSECTEACDDGLDNDGDGSIDCTDSDCDGSCDEDCDDARDNDGDGNTDCEDEDCFDICGTFEDCFDLVDNDRDLRIDCSDPDCWNVSSGCPEFCDDGADNDADGLLDCADPDCADAAMCEGDCTDGEDGNNDGLVDCDDPQCQGDAPCGGPEVCDDGLDNDFNGLADCEDPSCVDEESCSEAALCDDGADNDGDGFVDCDDEDCWGLICHPEGVTTWVIDGDVARGDMEVTRRVERSVYGNGASLCPTDIEAYTSTTEVNALFMVDIVGRARVTVNTASGASEQRTCDWTVALATAQMAIIDGENQRYGEATIINRGVVDVQATEDGGNCYLAGDDWLPQTFNRVTRPSVPGQYFRGLDVRIGTEDSAARYFTRTGREARLSLVGRNRQTVSYLSGPYANNSCAIEYNSTQRRTAWPYQLDADVHVSTTYAIPDGNDVDEDTDGLIFPPRWTAGGPQE